jgi:hypothetical protein
MTCRPRKSGGLTPFEHASRVNHAVFGETMGSDPAKEVERLGY